MTCNERDFDCFHDLLGSSAVLQVKVSCSFHLLRRQPLHRGKQGGVRKRKLHLNLQTRTEEEKNPTFGCIDRVGKTGNTLAYVERILNIVLLSCLCDGLGRHPPNPDNIRIRPSVTKSYLLISSRDLSHTHTRTMPIPSWRKIKSKD